MMFKIATIFKRGAHFYAMILFEDVIEPVYYYRSDSNDVFLEASLSLDFENLEVVTPKHFKAEIEYIRNHIKMFKEAPTSRLDILNEDKYYNLWLEDQS